MSQTCIVRLLPKEKDWKFAFQFRFHRDLPHELTLKYGCEMCGCAVPVSDPDPQVYRLPVAPGGFALERVRENLGTYALECNGFLQRSAFDAMPSSCLFQVPRRRAPFPSSRCG